MSQFNRQKASSPADIQYARRSAAIASARQRRSAAAPPTMRPTSTMDFLNDMDDHGSAMAMEVDDDSVDMFPDGGGIGENKVADLDFFNSFADDFDESDMTSPAAM